MMISKRLLIAVAAVAMTIGATGSMAQDRTRDQDQIYGSQLMNDQERNAHRDKIRTAKTGEERDQIRRDHHVQMQARAKERGLTLPSEPMMGKGPAPGGGKGPGGGMGPGGGPK
ncbi:MAG: hypothetical protein ACKVQT_27405 [Burkholderiales bacterium]